MNLRSPNKTADANIQKVSLSPRERQVIKGRILGREHKEIAAELGISVQAVKIYASRGYKKLKVQTALQLNSRFMCGRCQKLMTLFLAGS